jgi:hypothetical protein
LRRERLVTDDSQLGGTDRLRADSDVSGNAASRGANRVGNALDDLKDRVDGNPASRPGPDATDRGGRL